MSSPAQSSLQPSALFTAVKATAFIAVTSLALLKVLPSTWIFTSPSSSSSSSSSFPFTEITVDELQQLYNSGAYTCEDVVRMYLKRIVEVDRQIGLRSYLAMNPNAIAEARVLDAERRAGKLRGALHGIPIALKDNVQMSGLATTAGSAAMTGNVREDAPLVKKLRASGAVILGKLNLSEWANFRSTHSVSGWSTLGGQCRNPYALDRSPSGSSSGSGASVSANLCVMAVGTETDGSIVSPASSCCLVGVKPTVGLVSRTGVVPISSTQDTAGPMARTVRDAALMLTAMCGKDSADAATMTVGVPSSFIDYSATLHVAALRGKKIGAIRNLPGIRDTIKKQFQDNCEILRKCGATVVELDFPFIDADDKCEWDKHEMTSMQHDFHATVNQYLAGCDEKAVAIRSLKDLVEFNRVHANTAMRTFAQETFEASLEKSTALISSEEYNHARSESVRLTYTEGIEKLIIEHSLDCLVAPTGSPAWVIDHVNGDHFAGGCSSLAAIPGSPHVTVPGGFVHGLPVGFSFLGLKFTEQSLLSFAYAYECVSKHRRPPTFQKTLEVGNGW